MVFSVPWAEWIWYAQSKGGMHPLKVTRFLVCLMSISLYVALCCTYTCVYVSVLHPASVLNLHFALLKYSFLGLKFSVLKRKWYILTHFSTCLRLANKVPSTTTPTKFISVTRQAKISEGRLLNHSMLREFYPLSPQSISHLRWIPRVCCQQHRPVCRSFSYFWPVKSTLEQKWMISSRQKR